MKDKKGNIQSIREKIRGGREQKEFENIRVDKTLKMKIQKIVWSIKGQGRQITMTEVIEQGMDWDKAKSL